MLVRYADEIQERQRFIDAMVEAAQGESRDLSEQELELVTRARDRITYCNEQMGPLEEANRIAADSADRMAALAKLIDREKDKPRDVEYRSAGGYIIDRWRAGLGEREAIHRLDVYHRAAAHQTTPDNPGLLPEQIMGPVVNFVDQTRPLVTALGPRQLPSGSWSRPRVTQHTLVAEQTAEKTELASQKMVIGKIPVEANTFGGYVNVSRQNVDWTQPAIMDLIVGDLAGQYAIVTEKAAADQLTAAATAGPTLPATPDGNTLSAAIWEAVGTVWAAMHGAGRVIIACSPDMLGQLGPMFPNVNPQNSFGTGFTAEQFSTGAQGTISGIGVVVSAGLATGTILVLSTAAAEIYEDRVGALQVVEPSVLGVQVAYAGYFTALTIEAGGIVALQG